MTRRIERAMALPRRGGLSVTEVCFTVGCASRHAKRRLDALARAATGYSKTLAHKAFMATG